MIGHHDNLHSVLCTLELCLSEIQIDMLQISHWLTLGRAGAPQLWQGSRFLYSWLLSRS